MELFIIDAIGPFFKGYNRETINWSKIPFSHVEEDDGLNIELFKKIHKEFKLFIDSIAGLGYNAISIDDLAHLVSFDFYDDDLKALIAQYQNEFTGLFEYAKSKGLQIYITMDVMFFNRTIESKVGGNLTKISNVLEIAFEKLFENYDIDGVTFRIGETDGIDVKGQFKSKLILKTARQANKLIKHLLPLFEKFDKKMIFRTWSVGIYPIGDLMWNEKTFRHTFSGIQSDNFIISLKFGDTDFYDDLELSPMFNVGQHRKIIELQTRREREGFGELPYYVGWQYEEYFKKLSQNQNVIGVSVWCQSGGWSSWYNRTFLKPSSPWNEMNTHAVIDIYRYGMTADDSLLRYVKNKELVEFVRLSYELIHSIFYIKEMSATPLYFRRLRLPPLLWLFWDHAMLNPLLLTLAKYLGVGKYKIPKAELAEFLRQGQKLKIDNIDYMYDTLVVLARCRRAIWKKSIKKKHIDHIQQYKAKYEKPFKFSIHLSQRSYSTVEFLLRLLIRKQPQYRLIDRIFISPFVSALFRLIYRMFKKNLPSFANKQAMSVDMLFK